MTKTLLQQCLLSGLLVFAGLGCSKSNESTAPGTSAATPAEQALTIKGSDTMVILAQSWAQAFMKSHPGKAVQVSGGGSGTGIAALVNGTTDLADSSRPLKDVEKADVQTKRGAPAEETAVALDALAVYVNDANKLDKIDIPTLKKVFRGEITNWKTLNGNDKPIVLYSRENNSGTYAYFKEHVLNDEDFATTAQTLPGTAAVINAVSKDVNGIGYGGIGYAKGVRTLKVAKETGGEAIEPSMEAATSGTYPLARKLYVYSAGKPSGLAKEYLDFVLSPEGQKVVEGVGFYPLPK